MTRIFLSILLVVLLAGAGLVVAGFGGALPGYLRDGSDLDIQAGGKAQPLPMSEPRSLASGDLTGWRYAGDVALDPTKAPGLEVAWRHALPFAGADGPSTPILAEGRLIYCTQSGAIVAVDAADGRLAWYHDPQIGAGLGKAEPARCGGLALWQSPGEPLLCRMRVFAGTQDGRLLALDASNGAPCPEFGRAGVVTADPRTPLARNGPYRITVPPVVMGDTVIIGADISDALAEGDVFPSLRAFDAETGAALWAIDPIERGALTASAGASDPPLSAQHLAVGVEVPISADPDTQRLYVATSAPHPKYVGGARPGDNDGSSAVVAVDAARGRVMWSHQLVRHDLWGFDAIAQPVLLEAIVDGTPRPALAVAAGTGHVHLLDRETGLPLRPTRDRPLADGPALAEERPAPVQTLPRSQPLVPPSIDPERAFGLTWFDQRSCRAQLADLGTRRLFRLPTRRGILVDGLRAGSEARALGVDPKSGLLIATLSRQAEALRIVPSNRAAGIAEGRVGAEIDISRGAPFTGVRTPLFSELGLPCGPAPWSVLVGYDATEGKIVWRRTLGDRVISLLGRDVSLPLGSEGASAPLVLAGGTIAVSTGGDQSLRLFDAATGAERARYRLPGPTAGAPVAFKLDARAYIAVPFAGDPSRGVRAGGLVTLALPSGE